MNEKTTKMEREMNNVSSSPSSLNSLISKSTVVVLALKINKIK